MDEKLSDKIYKEIIKNIIDGTYSERDFISEAQIATKYGVSKAPVKEALHILSEQGYIVRYPRRGYMINAYSREEINQIQDIRRSLESLCLKKIIETASDSDIQALLPKESSPEQAVDPRSTANVSFHLGLAKLSGNPFLVDTLQKYIYIATIYNMSAAPDMNNFRHIVEALLKRDEEEAIEWLLTDIRYV